MRLSALSTIRAANVTVHTQNTGTRAGAHTIQLFASPPGAGQDGRPRKVLVAFDKVFLQPGESAAVQLPIHAQHLTLANALGERSPVTGPWRLWVDLEGEPRHSVVHVV